jgi:hypothetical protein
VLQTAVWILPVLAMVWIAVSAVGRTAVLRRLDPALTAHTGTLMVLGAVRLLFLAGTFLAWVRGLMWAGRVAITTPVAAGDEPNLVMYFALVICGTLALFVAWAAASWVLGIAPMLAMLHGYGPGESLRAATRLGSLSGKLVEINLVLGIVKIALIVLAMVFSATPLPFQSFTTDGFLWTWWAGVTVGYLIASDFFHVVRAAAYLELWRAYEVS